MNADSHRNWTTTLDRRTALSGLVAAGIAARAAAGEEAGAGTPATPVVDTNVSLFRWPFRRLPLDETPRLAERLRSLGVRRAWAGSFEGLLQRDVAAVNARLAEACRRHGGDLLVPFGSVNPALPDWEEDLRRCDESHRMPGVRLHPGYHGYTLGDTRFLRLLRLAAARRMIVQVAAAMEDRRTQHRLLQVADVDLTPLAAALKQAPGVRLQILNHRGTGRLAELLRLPGVHADIARVDGTDGVARLLRAAPPGRVLLGSHAPFLICRSPLIKVAESGLSGKEAAAVLHENAERLLKHRAAVPPSGDRGHISSSGDGGHNGLPPAEELRRLQIWDSYLLPAQGPDPGRFQAELERCRRAIRLGAIQRACVFLHVGLGTADAATEARLQNNPADVLTPLEQAPDLLLGMMRLSPRDVRQSLDALNRWMRDGPMVGVYFASSPRSLPCNHPNFDPLVERIHKLGGVIMQHTWFKTTGKDSAGESTPAELAQLARRHSDVPFICAHAGGEWEQGVRAIRPCPNVLAETSGFDPTAGFLEMAVRELGADRVVFGSHLPSRSLGTELGKVLGADLTPADRRKILGANLRRLVGRRGG